MKNLMAAFLAAQQEFPALVADATNPHFKSRYATLAAVQAATFPTLAKHGLVVLQEAASDLTDAGLIVRVAATLYHVASGESASQELGLLPAKQDPQGVGSALSYGRRYVLMCLLGLAPDDDDGNAATGIARPTPVSSTSPARTTHQAGNGAVVRDDFKPATPARPAWTTPGEAIDAGEAMGLFKHHQHARAAFSEVARSISGREGFTAEQLPAIFDAWHKDLARRQQKQPA